MAPHPKPGRLGNPDETLGTDPRTDPRLVAAIEPLGLAGHGDPLPVAVGDPTEAQIEFCNVAEEGYQAVFDAMLATLAPVEGVARSIETIVGADGNDITLYVHRPSADHPDAGDDLPGILHIHGGGMVSLMAVDPNCGRWRARPSATFSSASMTTAISAGCCDAPTARALPTFSTRLNRIRPCRRE